MSSAWPAPSGALRSKTARQPHHMQRAFDLITAAVGLVLLAPLFVLIAGAIWAEDAGPVFYAQPRVGRGFRTFRLLKFRTMAPNTDRLGLAITTAFDPRVTRVGALLRRYKLDE